MNIREINKPMTAKSLNENLAKRFGSKIDLDAFTLEQLQDARNKMRTKLSQVETTESFDSVHTSESYQKNKLFLDVLNAAVTEREEIAEKGKDQVDEFDGVDSQDDADQNLMKAVQKKFGTKSGRNLGRMTKQRYWKSGREGGAIPADMDVTLDDPVVKMMLDAGILKLNPSALKQYKAMQSEDIAEKDKMPDKNKDGIPDYAQDGKGKNDLGKDAKPKDKKSKDLSKVPPQLRKHMKKDEGKEIINNYFKTLVEGKEDEAEIVMAAKDMVDRVTNWMEDTAEMQAESMLELGDAIRDEMGQEKSDAFIASVKPALESLYSSLESTRGTLTGGVAQLTGEGAPAQDMGAEGGEEPIPAETDADMEPTVDQEDDFSASEPAAGGEEEAGRDKRESKIMKHNMLETSRRLGTILSKKK